MNLIVTNPIIMILKAILNYFRIRRNYIADAVDKIPPEIKDALVAWYSPYCKQRMTNFDVIEAYIEDFTKWAYRNSRGTAKITNNTIVITNVVETNNIVEDDNEPYSDLTISVTGVTENKYLIVRQGRGKPETHIKKDDVYTFKDNNLYFGFGVSVIGVKEYSGMSIGNGKIAIGIPGTDKSIVLEANDIETFKQSLVK